MHILILGASYGSLLSTKLLMAGHNVDLVCRPPTASLINKSGTFVEIRLKGETKHTVFSSTNLQGKVRGITPDEVIDLSPYALIVLAMQESQYSTPPLRSLMSRIATSTKPCLSLMNMPPLPYLQGITSLADINLDSCYHDPSLWREFPPNLISLCSPDPQAYRLPNKPLNFLSVTLPTNFKSAPFFSANHNAILKQLSTDIESLAVPVKLRLSNSRFTPFAKWSMLICGNYRCLSNDNIRPISEAVHSDLSTSAKIYDEISQLVCHLGATEKDIVPFEKYAKAAQTLHQPSSVARAIANGSPQVERVDLLIQTIARTFSINLPWLEEIVDIIDHRLSLNTDS